MDTRKYLSYASVKKQLQDIFCAYGFQKEETKIIVDSLLAADLAGIESHGIQRMVRYAQAIDCGMVAVGAEPSILWETPLSAVIDAQKAMGQLVSAQAMQLAIRKAESNGVGMVAVRNSNHFGIAGHYARMASSRGFVGVAMTNSEAIMVPTHGRCAMLGTNPIALAFPAEPVDFCFDAATTVVPRGKLEVYRKDEKPTPREWMVDAEGISCTDADKVIQNITNHAGGGILPLGGLTEMTGGHKGYGFGMICELFTSVLSGGAFSYQSYQIPNVADTAHFFMAIDCNLFGESERIKASCSSLLEDMRNAATAQPGDRIYIHGEKEAEAAKQIRKNGIPANHKTVEELRKIAAYLNIPYCVEETI